MIVEIAAVSFVSLCGFAGYLLTVKVNRKRVEGWRDTATACGLEVFEQSRRFGGWVRLLAREDALQARIEDARRKDVSTRIVVSVPGPPGFSGVRIRREALYRPTVREIEIGDADFDSAFSIEGPMRLVAALLDAETRNLLNEVKANCLRMGIVNGEIMAYMHDWLVPILLPPLLDIGRHIPRDLDVAQRLAANVRQDPQAGVRLLNLRLLAREFPGEPGTLEALRQACSDPSLHVRLQAARDLNAEGRDTLLGLAEDMVDDGCSAQAVSALGSALPFERARDLLVAAMRRRRLETARACVEALGRSGGAGAVGVLAKVLAREKGEVAVAAALALGETGSGEAEPPLIQALQSGKTEVRAAAAKSLGRVGSSAAVLLLKEAAEAIPSDPELRKVARQAVAEIQSRLSGASPGQLSLAGDEAGQLSLAEAEAGQLSLAADPAGQLSLSSDPAGRLSLPGGETPQRPERTSG